jgi:hypothetical protein
MRTWWLALAITLMTLPAAARSLPAAGPPGSYLLASDAEGRLIAASYWIGDSVKVTVRVLRGGGHEIVHVDREFLPRRTTDSATFLIRRFDYAPDVQPEALQAGAALTIMRKSFAAVFGTPPGPVVSGERADGTATLRIRVTRIGARDIGGLPVRQIAYDIEDPAPPTESRAGPQRVYFPDLDLDLGAGDAARLAKVERGDAFSSDDFGILVEQRVQTDPAIARCIADRRSQADYRAAQDAYRNLADAHTAKHFPETGLEYILDKGIKELQPILQRTSVGACFPKPAPR